MRPRFALTRGLARALAPLRLRHGFQATLALAFALGCTAWAMLALADERRRTIDVSRVFDADAGAPIEIVVGRIPADPPPLVERRQWIFDLRWDRGEVWLLGARKVELPAPQATPRVMGRFAVELYEGAALIERVRFDFPMLAVPEANVSGRSASPSLTQKLRTRIGVVFPAVDRGTRLELWDRATDRRWSLPWPPSDAAVSSDAGGAPDRRESGAPVALPPRF